MKKPTKALGKTTWPLFTLLLLGGLIYSLAACNNAPPEETAGAEETPEEVVHKETSPLARGEELYVSYCKICHGEYGDGPMVELLKAETPDLTKIAARRDGAFPEEEIHMIIDGRKKLEKGHGSGDMPIWGVTFRESENLKSDELVDEEIDKLVMYLKSIQREAESEPSDS